MGPLLQIEKEAVMPLIDGPIPGDVLRMTSFHHHTPRLTVTYKAHRDKVAVFLLLGHESRDGSDILDVPAALNRLGWYDEAPSNEYEHKFNYLSTRILD